MSRRVVAIICRCNKYSTDDPNDAHFDYPDHSPADIETVGFNG